MLRETNVTHENSAQWNSFELQDVIDGLKRYGHVQSYWLIEIGLTANWRSVGACTYNMDVTKGRNGEWGMGNGE